MGKVNYTVLSGVSDQIDSLCNKLVDIDSNCTSYPGSVEVRLKEYYSDYFSGISSANESIVDSLADMKTFGEWFNGLIASGNAVDQGNAGSARKAGDSASSTGGDGSTSQGTSGSGATGASASGTGGDGSSSQGTAGDGATGASASGTGGDGSTSQGTAGSGATGASASGTGGDGTGASGGATSGATGASAESSAGAGAGAAGAVGAGATAASAIGVAGASAAGIGQGGVGAAAASISDAIAGAMEDIAEGTSPLDSLLLSSLAGLGSVFSLNTSDADKLQHYAIDPEEWKKLSPEEQEAIKAKLKELGFTDKEIEDIISGKRSVVGSVQDVLAAQLQKLLKEHPELRQKLIDMYGIDIFNPDGTVDKTKLTLAMLMDEKSSKDSLSLINYLHDSYGIDLVVSGRITKVMNKLLKAIKKSPLIRKLLIKRYGFDIFNKDGTVNYEKLVKALIMDDAKPNDIFDIEKLIEEFNKSNGILLLLKSYFGGGFLSFFGAGTAVVSGSVIAFGIGSKIFKNYKDSKNPIINTNPKCAVVDDENYYVVSKERLSHLQNEISIFEKRLLEVSYNSDEIANFKEGNYSVLRKLLDEIESVLETLVVEHEDIKQKIYQLYGFDVFDDNEVNKTKLAIMIIIDFKDDVDRFDIIKLLNENYDINIIVKEEFNKIIKVLKENIDNNKENKEILNTLYGDEIVDEDLKVDEDKIKDILAKEYREQENKEKNNNTLVDKLNSL